MGDTAVARTMRQGARRLAAVNARAVRKMGSTRAFAAVVPHVLPPLDRLLHRLSGGRVTVISGMLPVLMLTTTGARSGRERMTPLACVPEEDGSFLVVGSNFGRAAHPAWSGNLIKHPEARVSFQGRDIPVEARLLDGVERERAWAAALAVWPPYADYQARVDRRIRLFRLAPRQG